MAHRLPRLVASVLAVEPEENEPLPHPSQDRVVTVNSRGGLGYDTQLPGPFQGPTALPTHLAGPVAVIDVPKGPHQISHPVPLE